MVSNTHYDLKRHRKFEHEGDKYVVDLETGNVVQVNDVEWDILDHYGTQTSYQIVEQLKANHKVTSIFEGIEYLERLGQRGVLLHPRDEMPAQPTANWKQTQRKPKLLVPFHFAQEESSHDFITNLNRYQMLTHLAKFAVLETLKFSKTGQAEQERQTKQDFGEDIYIRNIEVEEGHTRAAAWYAMNEYDGILLLSQYLTDVLPYYQVPNTPIVHCVENTQNGQNSTRETLLDLYGHQKEKDTLVVNASWLKTWLDEFELPAKRVHVINDGINVVETIGRALAKQQTAAFLNKPMFAQHPVVGLISGFQSHSGVQFLSNFAKSNPNIAFFVYDSFLAEYYHNPPDNVILFSAEDEVIRAILPIFLQAFDLVCFPAIPGTPFSLVLETMAYGTPCIALSQYGIPEEVRGAGVAVKSEWDGLGHFHVPCSELSKTVHQWLKPSSNRTKCERVATEVIEKYTWDRAAQQTVHLFAGEHQAQNDNSRRLRNMFPLIFCRQYEPGTGTTVSRAYQTRSHRYESLENTLAEELAEHHTSAEVEFVFRHLQK